MLYSFLFHASAKLTEDPGMAGVNVHASVSDLYEADNDDSSSAAHIRTTASHNSVAAELPRGQKIQGKCFNCDCVGHKAADCPKERRVLPKMKQNPPKPPCEWHSGARRAAVRQY